MLSGDNGILQKATQSKEKTERAEIIENAKLDILAKISEKKGENITAEELEELLTSANYNTQGTLSNEESILDRTLTSKDEKYQIPVSEIYNGNLSTESNDKTITFYIDNRPYEAKEGMNFAQWLEEYSPEIYAGFSDDCLWIGNSSMRVNGPGMADGYIRSYSVIEEDGQYYSYYD